MADALNETIGGKLREMADVLEQQQADGFRISAYRRAAATVESLTSSIGDIAHADGLDGLMAPPVALLLDVDREYREKAGVGSLRLIARKRFNPAGEAWLPVFHTARGQWRFTALFSNTRKAHELGKTKDWVVIYAHMDTEPESPSTVVTERRGPLSGRRVVRGREAECGLYDGAKEPGSPAPVPSANVDGASGCPSEDTADTGSCMEEEERMND